MTELEHDRDEYLAKVKEIQYQIDNQNNLQKLQPPKKEISESRDKVSHCAKEISDVLIKEFDPSERSNILKEVRNLLKENLGLRADEIEKELHYLKEVNASL
jgi:uncharacterized protein YjgD (DUF1641 family)